MGWGENEKMGTTSTCMDEHCPSGMGMGMGMKSDEETNETNESVQLQLDTTVRPRVTETETKTETETGRRDSSDLAIASLFSAKLQGEEI